MTIRQVVSTVTVAAPDAYGTPTTFCQGQVLDVAPGGVWEGLIGTGILSTLGGQPLASDQDGDGGQGTGNP